MVWDQEIHKQTGPMIYSFTIYFYRKLPFHYLWGLKSKGNSTWECLVLGNWNPWTLQTDIFVLAVFFGETSRSCWVSQVFELFKTKNRQKNMLCKTCWSVAFAACFLPRQSFCFVARWYGSFSTIVFYANVSRFFGEEQRLCWLSKTPRQPLGGGF